MTTMFEFRRHSIKDGVQKGTIGPKGYALARAVGQKQLRGRAFTHFFASGLWRTHQTMAAFHEGAADLRLYATPTQPPLYLDWPDLLAMWRHCHKVSQSGGDMVQAAFQHDLVLAERAAAEIARRFKAWAPTLPDGAKVLVVGHSPTMELMVYGLSGITMPGLKECAGFRVYCHREQVFSVTIDFNEPGLDPASIRDTLFGGRV